MGVGASSTGAGALVVTPPKKNSSDSSTLRCDATKTRGFSGDGCGGAGVATEGVTVSSVLSLEIGREGEVEVAREQAGGDEDAGEGTEGGIGIGEGTVPTFI